MVSGIPSAIAELSKDNRMSGPSTPHAPFLTVSEREPGQAFFGRSHRTMVAASLARQRVQPCPRNFFNE
jgi:hypothetical protein